VILKIVPGNRFLNPIQSITVQPLLQAELRVSHLKMAEESFYAPMDLILRAKSLYTSKSKEYSQNMGSDYSSPRGYFRVVMGIESDHSP
jgi:hypothetical protein